MGRRHRDRSGHLGRHLLRDARAAATRCPTVGCDAASAARGHRAARSRPAAATWCLGLAFGRSGAAECRRVLRPGLCRRATAAQWRSRLDHGGLAADAGRDVLVAGGRAADRTDARRGGARHRWRVADRRCRDGATRLAPGAGLARGAGLVVDRLCACQAVEGRDSGADGHGLAAPGRRSRPVDRRAGDRGSSPCPGCPGGGRIRLPEPGRDRARLRLLVHRAEPAERGDRGDHRATEPGHRPGARCRAGW